MSALYLLVAIASRSRMPDFASVYKEQNVSVNLGTLGHGTANSELLNIFGLENSEKAVCFAVVTEENWTAVKKSLESEVRIDVPGTGIAFTVPLSSIGGKRELMFLTNGQNYWIKTQKNLKN